VKGRSRGKKGVVARTTGKRLDLKKKKHARGKKGKVRPIKGTHGNSNKSRGGRGRNCGGSRQSPQQEITWRRLSQEKTVSDRGKGGMKVASFKRGRLKKGRGLLLLKKKAALKEEILDGPKIRPGTKRPPGEGERGSVESLGRKTSDKGERGDYERKKGWQQPRWKIRKRIVFGHERILGQGKTGFVAKRLIRQREPGSRWGRKKRISDEKGNAKKRGSFHKQGGRCARAFASRK